MSARELARLLRTGSVGAVEALTEHLDRIAAVNPALNAVVSLDPDRALRRAKELDALPAEDRGPLHGVPMTLKDGNDVAGLRTTMGTYELDRVADTDGAVASRLHSAGAVITGHTNVPPFLADYQSANPVFGRTANPWDTSRTPGGSSGGAAAALAAGLTPLEYGSDLAGSLRLPAAFCGVYGFKTTEQRVPSTGFFAVPGTPRSVRVMSVLGPMATDLDDLELALRLTSGPDGADLDVPPVPLPEPTRRDLAGLRLAVVPALPGATVSRAVRTVVEMVAAKASDAGAQVVERLPELDWDGLHEVYGGLLGAVTQVFVPGAEEQSLAWYLTALDRRDRYTATFERYFSGDVDALVLPATMTTAFPHTDGDTQVIDGEQVRYDAHGHPLVFANLTGQPALSVPAGFDGQGLPVGVQLVGPRWSEIALLDIARALETAGVLPGFETPSRISG
jgi:amidase